MPLTSTRSRILIVAWEVVALGGATVILTLFSAEFGRIDWSLTSFSWLDLLIGVALVLVGWEAVALSRRINEPRP
jgi:hypothetical protein